MRAPLIVIVGETASGKSALAMALAKKFDGEIINGDSWITRVGLDIGTDKPSKQDMIDVKHYLVDVAKPPDDFTAADFKRLAEKAINEVYSRGKVPILVGGSGLYIDSILFNYSFLEAGDREKRKELNSKTIPQLLKIISELEITMPSNLDKNNKRRLIRLIEVGGKLPSKERLRPNTVIIGIKNDAKLRRANIENRVNKMIALGLEDEVKGLVKKFGWECDALKGIGYRQWKSYLEGSQTLDETRIQIVNATVNLAKKQTTWFNRNKSIQWFTTPVKTAHVVDFLTTKYSSLCSN